MYVTRFEQHTGDFSTTMPMYYKLSEGKDDIFISFRLSDDDAVLQADDNLFQLYLHIYIYCITCDKWKNVINYACMMFIKI